MRRILGIGLAVPLAALAVVLVTTSAGSTLERVFFAAFPGLLALRLALGKGRAPGLLLLGGLATLGMSLAWLITARTIGDQTYPTVERIRYAVLLAGIACLPLAALLPFRGRLARIFVLAIVGVVYLPVAFIALQVHRPHVRAVWASDGGEHEPRRIEVEAPDGAVMRGWVWAGRTNRSPLVVLLHGIGSDRADLVHLARVYRARGWAVSMFDSRGHGESDSMTVTFGWRERADVRAIVSRLTGGDRSVPVALHGCSMGAAIALQAAADLPQVRAVIAEAPFYDLETMATDQVAWLPGPLARSGVAVFDALAPLELGGPMADVSPARAIAKRRDLRTLLIVGGRDHVIPPSHGRRLRALAAGPTRLWQLPQAEHCAAWAVAPREFPQRVSDALTEAFGDGAARAAARPGGARRGAPPPSSRLR